MKWSRCNAPFGPEKLRRGVCEDCRAPHDPVALAAFADRALEAVLAAAGAPAPGAAEALVRVAPQSHVRRAAEGWRIAPSFAAGMRMLERLGEIAPELRGLPRRLQEAVAARERAEAEARDAAERTRLLRAAAEADGLADFARRIGLSRGTASAKLMREAPQEHARLHALGRRRAVAQLQDAARVKATPDEDALRIIALAQREDVASFAEVAEAAGWSVATVRRVLTRHAPAVAEALLAVSRGRQREQARENLAAAAARARMACEAEAAEPAQAAEAHPDGTPLQRPPQSEPLRGRIWDARERLGRLPEAMRRFPPNEVEARLAMDMAARAAAGLLDVALKAAR